LIGVEAAPGSELEREESRLPSRYLARVGAMVAIQPRGLDESLAE
jgi:hypothetical protein